MIPLPPSLNVPPFSYCQSAEGLAEESICRSAMWTASVARISRNVATAGSTSSGRYWTSNRRPR